MCRMTVENVCEGRMPSGARRQIGDSMIDEDLLFPSHCLQYLPPTPSSRI